MASAALRSEPEARPFEWAGKLKTSHVPARLATLLDGRGPCDLRRVMVLGDYAAKLPSSDPKSKHATVFLYNEDGTLDHAPEYRLVHA